MFYSLFSSFFCDPNKYNLSLWCQIMIRTFWKKTASKILFSVSLTGALFARGRLQFIMFPYNKGRWPANLFATSEVEVVHADFINSWQQKITQVCCGFIRLFLYKALLLGMFQKMLEVFKKNTNLYKIKGI